MALPYNVAIVLRYFLRRITAYDLTIDYVDHEAKTTKGPEYHFSGVLLPPTDKDINLFDEGELANGAMTLYVNKRIKLHINSELEWGETFLSRQRKQTIILFDGDEYRVKGYSNRSDDGIHRKYTLVRYIDGRS